MSNPYCTIADLFDRYDAQTDLQLSGDDNAADGDKLRIGRLLDAQAARLESALAGRYALPAILPLTVIGANISAAAASFTVGSATGITIGQRLYLGPDGTNQPETITVGTVNGTTITMANGATTQFAHTTSTTIYTVPGVLTDWVATKTALRLFGRRPDRPTALDADNKDADEWMEKLLSYRITIPGLSRDIPQLEDSNFIDGESQFDRVFGQLPSDTGPSAGK